MAALQIIGAPQSNFVWVVRILCGEKNVPYELVSARPHTPEVDAIHPFGKIPVMRHGDVTLCESRAICGYIDRTFPGPAQLPADPAIAAQVEQWVSMLCTTIDPLWFRQYLAAYVFPGTPDGAPDRSRIDASIPKMKPQFATMEQAVAETGHLVGDGFTLADAYFTPILYYMNQTPESRAIVEKSAPLRAYLDRHLSRKSVRETIPPPLPSVAPR